MAKNRQTQLKKEKQEEKLRLQDALGSDVLEKLKQAKQELTVEEEEKKKAEAERRRAERKRREKNKSFAELLEESDMDWRKFK
ncbi:sulfurtransferase [Weizmannia acidilactici]|uniref:Sulfurtransferase n=1 Tax=Weizmannia acidilactici TaxID=2607726 RepID=A0A5J4JDB3_9BACI|nr:YqkE family protein [Weizmannia acidilactici]GER66095.1 sulfurtransferase [Weizmannia acidilactici]GER69269.1 sulfurtransferase [Weizmannia acidilactici]GER72404.1 sulfurtransferase [Weizmannia acidilactici]